MADKAWNNPFLTSEPSPRGESKGKSEPLWMNVDGKRFGLLTKFDNKESTGELKPSWDYRFYAVPEHMIPEIDKDPQVLYGIDMNSLGDENDLRFPTSKLRKGGLFTLASLNTTGVNNISLHLYPMSKRAFENEKNLESFKSAMLEVMPGAISALMDKSNENEDEIDEPLSITIFHKEGKIDKSQAEALFNKFFGSEYEASELEAVNNGTPNWVYAKIIPKKREVESKE